MGYLAELKRDDIELVWLVKLTIAKDEIYIIASVHIYEDMSPPYLAIIVLDNPPSTERPNHPFGSILWKKQFGNKSKAIKALQKRAKMYMSGEVFVKGTKIQLEGDKSNGTSAGNVYREKSKKK
jgi:hypothetical protein